ncbi:hypothetical protein WJX79_002423 [Trebouxia sp. C0005]
MEPRLSCQLCRSSSAFSTCSSRSDVEFQVLHFDASSSSSSELRNAAFLPLARRPRKSFIPSSTYVTDKEIVGPVQSGSDLNTQFEVAQGVGREKDWDLSIFRFTYFCLQFEGIQALAAAPLPRVLCLRVRVDLAELSLLSFKVQSLYVLSTKLGKVAPRCLSSNIASISQ